MSAVVNLLNHGFLGNGRSAFRGVVAVVQADANDLLRIWNGRQQLDAVFRKAHSIGRVRHDGDGLQCRRATLENGPQAGGQLRVGAVEVKVKTVLIDNRARSVACMNGR